MAASVRGRESRPDTTGAPGPAAGLEVKFDELRTDIFGKIHKELDNSTNTRNYICRKFDELAGKVQCLTDLDATISGFRSDVKSIERQIGALAQRIDDIEKRTIYKECPSAVSAVFQKF